MPWALILGGSSGLGLASAKKLAAHGYNICIVHRDRKSRLDDLEVAFSEMIAHGVRVINFNKDALQKENRKKIIDQLPKQRVKVLIHSVAKGSLKPMSGPGTKALSKEDIDITLHAMGSSWYEWTRALIDADCFSKNARNIAFTSEGNSKAWPGYGAVSAAKATLEALMRNMAVELAPLDITTNCIQAGTTETPSFLMIPGSDTLAKMAKKRNPFKRLTRPEDVANAVYLLCSDEAKWINGTVLTVDGGESIR
ncbi:MAG: short-chain dehydrogenase [Altibacter sp.]|nr:SDR family oxidoreductase [Altibacter sp.]MAP53824.1 short-chain dehydrogenase [Altibacter sp.]